MRSLRARLILSFVAVGVVPPLLVGFFTQQAMTAREQARMSRALEDRVGGVREHLARRAEADRMAVSRLCLHDLAVDSFLMDISRGTDGPESEARLARVLPPVMTSLGFESLTLIDRRDARIRASAHAPSAVGTRAPSLLSAADVAGGKHFLEGDELQIACAVSRGAAAITVVLGRKLTSHIEGDRLGRVGTSVVRLAEPDEPAREVIARFEDARGRAQKLLVGEIDVDASREDLRLVRLGVLGVSGLAALVALALGLVIAMRIGRALEALEAASDRVAGGDLEATIEGTGEGEIGRALHAFNRMTHELRGARLRLRRVERIAAWRDVARRIAHEIKNPLLPLQLSIETLRKTKQRNHPEFDEIFWESTETMLEEVTRLSRIVSEFSRFARMPPPVLAEMDLSRLVEKVASPYEDPRIELDLAHPCELVGDRDQLTQVVTNLLQNALAEARSRVRIRTEDHGSEVRLVVEDDGPGVPEDEREAIFEPYFTKKEGGTGLGLAIVDRIVGDHGGGIELTASSLGGARFVIALPVEGPPPEAAATFG